MDVFNVAFSDNVKKSLIKVPSYILKKLQAWVDGVETYGLLKTRKIPGYHDEPLKGKRTGQRSIRLNRAYRAIYVINENGTIAVVQIIEVNKHEY